MLKRRVTLFGRSIPLTLILALVVVVTAFAAWALLRAWQLDVTTASLGPVALDSVAANIAADPVGMLDCAGVKSGDDALFTMGDAYPGAQCEFVANYNNGGLVALYFGSIPNPDPTNLIWIDQTCGDLFAGNGVPANVLVSVSPSSNPGTSYGPYSFDVEFTADPPTCP